MGNGEGGRESQTTHISYLAFPVPIPMPFTILPFTLTATIGLISKKQFYKCSTLFCTFFRRCFARYNVKLPVTRFMEEMLYVLRLTFFSPPLIFTLVAASISHFLTAAIKFSCFSSNEIGLRCCFCCFLLLLLLAYFSL